jgi:AcrR family transcriptional regulator
MSPSYSEQTRTPQQQRSIARREQILKATRQVIAVKGYANLTMTEIAEVAGITVSSMYQYFRNKAEIILALCQQAADETNTLMQQSFATEIHNRQQWCDLLLELVEKLYLYYRHEPAMRDVWLASATDKDMQQIDEQDFERSQQFMFDKIAPDFAPQSAAELARTLELVSRFAISAVYLALKQPAAEGDLLLQSAKTLLKDSWQAFVSRQP